MAIMEQLSYINSITL